MFDKPAERRLIKQFFMGKGIVRVGIAGWTYQPWRTVFYPKQLARNQELAYAASRFRAVEINSTFHAMHRPDMFREWAEQVPAEFVFTLKGPRLVTHVLRLQNAETAVANFIASGLLRLGLHLGPLVWQLPANLRFNPARIEPFFRLLPRTTLAAADLGRRHDQHLRAPAWLAVDVQRPMRHAVEIGHPSFRCQAFIDLLRAYEVAPVFSDVAGRPSLRDLTSDFVYCRLDGPVTCVPGGYDDGVLETWINRIRAWAAGHEPADADRVGGKGRPRRRDVYVVFDNTRKIRAPANAMEMIRRLRR